MYEESDKPNNSIDYLKKNLGAPVELDTLKLKSELDKVKDENVKLRKELEQHRKEVFLVWCSCKISNKKTAKIDGISLAHKKIDHSLVAFPLFRTLKHLNFLSKNYPSFTSISVCPLFFCDEVQHEFKYDLGYFYPFSRLVWVTELILSWR